MFQGDNAQGKSNLLEAVYLLATSRSPRALTEKEIINWSAAEDPVAACRLQADVLKSNGKVHLELVLLGNKSSTPDELRAEGRPGEHASLQKRIRVNGVPRRVADLLGVVNAVLFSPGDLELVSGAPGLRRRYMDVLNCQIDRRYLRSLQRYNRVLAQRNRLLRLIGERNASPDELSFWDREMVEHGSYILWRRCRTLNSLKALARTIHLELTGGREDFDIVHVERLSQGEPVDVESESGLEALGSRFSAALKMAQGKEIARGMSLVGPHRSDLRFTANGTDAGVYGSRGQVRTVALSLRLAEARLMLGQTGEQPLLLLDDVLSELDDSRRSYLLKAVDGFDQTLITTADLRYFDPAFLGRASLYRVKAGSITALTPEQSGAGHN